MDSFELFDYLNKVSEYIEYSFYTNSAEIMEAILNKGFDNVFMLFSSTEIKKGLFKCNTGWKISEESTISKVVTIDLTNEMIFITEDI